MVRRSDHCLPSDSDKFTIKLHSLLQVSSCPLSRRDSLSLSLSLTSGSSLSRHPFRAAGASSRLWTHGSSFGRGGILTSDNHNSLYTRATVSSPSPWPPSRSLLFRPSRPRRSLFLFLLAFSHHFFAMSFLYPSPSAMSPDHPVASTTAIPQLFSTFLALIAVAVRRRISRAFRYYILYWSFFLRSLSFSRLFSLLFIPFFFLLSSIYFSSCRTFLRTFAFPPTFCIFFHSRNGHRNS